LVDYFLVLGQHVVLDYLLSEQIYYFIVVNAMSGASDFRGLVETKSAFEGEFDSIEEYVAGLVEHGFSFLNKNRTVPFYCWFCHLLKGYLFFSISVPLLFLHWWNRISF